MLQYSGTTIVIKNVLNNIYYWFNHRCLYNVFDFEIKILLFEIENISSMKKTYNNTSIK